MYYIELFRGGKHTLPTPAPADAVPQPLRRSFAHTHSRPAAYKCTTTYNRRRRPGDRSGRGIPGARIWKTE